jgi:hypothetical protein
MTDESTTSKKESRSAYVGTNYEDEPTINSEAGDKPQSCHGAFQNRKK